VVAEQLREQAATFATVLDAEAPDRVRVERMVREYFSISHRDDRPEGCPSAALLDEIGRCPDAARAAYTDGVLAIADGIAAYLAPHDPEALRVRVLGVMAAMIGTLQLSRALADRQLADEILEQGIQNALMLLDAGPRT
jgi:hypothetical protein